MTIKKVRGVYQLNKKLQTRLNQLNGISQYPKEFKVCSVHKFVKIKITNKGKFAYALQKIDKGTTIYHASGSKVSLPLRYTIQIDRNVHIIGPSVIDHACVDPTCIIDSKNNLIAKRAIRPEERITYNYLTTEYDIFNKFQCTCSQENCFRLIKGFKYLNPEERMRLKEELSLSNYLSRLLE